MNIFEKWKAKRKGNIKLMILDVLPFTLIFLVLNWIAFSCRYLCGGVILNGLNMFMQHPLDVIMAAPIISLNPIDLGIGVIGAFFLFLVLMDKKANQKHFKKGTEHGSARWGTHEDIKPFIETTTYWDKTTRCVVPEKKALDKNGKLLPNIRKETNPNGTRNNAILSSTEFLTMNGKPKDWKTARNKNICVIGGSGSGKTRYFIKPNIMQMHSSYIVTDPKGTIVNELGDMLVKHGYDLKIFNLINFDQSMRYNPMAYIKEEQDILKLVEVIMKNTTAKGASAGDPFWDKAEKLLYQSIIAMIIFEFPEKERNLNTVAIMIGAMEVREDDDTFKNAVDLMFDDLEKEKPGCFAVKQYKNYKLAAGKTAKSILISCASRLAPFNIPKLADLVKEDEMNLLDIGRKKTALFVIIPDTDATFNFMVSIMYTQLFNLLCTMADEEYGGRLPVHVRCLLDEFANIGQIPEFEKLIATIRSREISASIVLQTKAQLKSIYKDDADTILGNCDTQIFLGGREGGTLKELVEELGKQTIDDYNTSDTRGTSLSKGLNYSKLARDLMTRDEIQTMPKEKCIVQVLGLYPFFSDKYDLTKHPMYKYHAEDMDDARWFDVKKFISHLPSHRNYEITPEQMKEKKRKELIKFRERQNQNAMNRKYGTSLRRSETNKAVPNIQANKRNENKKGGAN